MASVTTAVETHVCRHWGHKTKMGNLRCKRFIKDNIVSKQIHTNFSNNSKYNMQCLQLTTSRPDVQVVEWNYEGS